MYFASKVSKLLTVLACTAGIAAVGCVPQAGTKTTVTSGSDAPDINTARAEAYDGPKARIAVARFTDKTRKGWYSRGIGQGMADQLTSALVNSGRFIVVDRQDVDTVIREQDFGMSGRVKGATAARVGQIEGAELLVVAAVTEFEGDAGGTRGAGGGAGGGILGVLAGGVKRSHMAIDLKVIDATTSRILAATSVEGEATDVNLGGLLGGYTGSVGLGGALQSWENTPKEKALRQVINKSVEFIAAKTPSSFYRYGAGGSRSVRSGSGGALSPAVKEAQTLLNQLGYNAGAVDGLMGGKTRTALKEFQGDRGLAVTGLADGQTLKALREAVK